MTFKQWFSCGRKIRYLQARNARRAMERLEKKGSVGLHVYKCGTHYHVGHRKGRKNYQARTRAYSN